MYIDDNQSVYTLDFHNDKQIMAKAIKTAYTELRKKYTIWQIQHMLLEIIQSTSTFEQILKATPTKAMDFVIKSKHGGHYDK